MIHTITIRIDDSEVEVLRRLTGQEVGWTSSVVKAALEKYIRLCACEKVVAQHNERMQLMEYSDYLAKKRKG